jgi:15-cis-phytoene synthase
MQTMARYGLAAATLIDLIEARAFDLYDDPMPSVAALEGYVRRTSSALFALAATVLGAALGIVDEIADAAGFAHGTIALLRAFALHASRGQLYLPADLIDRHDARAADIFAGRTTDALRAALAELRARVRGKLDAFASSRRALPRAAAPAFLPVALAPLYLNRMEARDYDPFATPVEVAQWRRQWTLWRAARARAS